MAETHTTIAGNPVDDPELRHTSGGTAATVFTVAVTERRQEGDTWKDGETGYFRCTAWRDLVSHVAESLTKGARVLVVDDLGPSLRWATAEVTKAQRATD